ncbi:EF-hand domain-containing protein [Oceanibium sediminis]|uniref:EF-hand domain-containing protein n=1 Tax=Oceanibium sediminis TaxID=2026339 RepID=UPI000DD36DEF|nr:EF-hand domain-containing protein [Oceanibium sediminis]
MKKPLILTGGVAATVLVLAGAAFADFETADADASGGLNAEELVAAFPDATEETFAAVDTNADGVVDAEEYTVALEAGLLPKE